LGQIGLYGAFIFSACSRKFKPPVTRVVFGLRGGILSGKNTNVLPIMSMSNDFYRGTLKSALRAAFNAGFFS
jgi:hypothetical protein